MYQDYEGGQQAFYQPDPFSKQAFNPRLGFVRKVYSIVSVQLLATTLMVMLCMGPLRSYLTYPEHTFPFALFILCSVMALILCIAVACYPAVGRRVPTNYFILGLFTLCEAYTVGYITVFAEPMDVLLAASLALSMTLVLTIYAFTTKTDFTTWGAFLWIAAWGLIAFSLMFFFIGPTNAAFTPLVITISVVTIIIYGIYLVYDTQLIMGGKRFELSLDDYIIAAMVIYIDVIVLFLKFLEIIQAVRRS